MPAVAQLVGHVLGGVLRGHEHQHARPAVCLRSGGAAAAVRAAGVDLDGALHDVAAASSSSGVGTSMRTRVVQQRARQRLHRRREGGREEQVLPLRGQQREHARRARRRSPGRAGGRPRRAPASPRRRGAARCARPGRAGGPGVATTMSAPPRRAIICGLIDTPPSSHGHASTGSGRWRAKLAQHSRRPAPRARAWAPAPARAARRGACDARGPAQRCSSGRTNAAVLPEPVCAVAQHVARRAARPEWPRPGWGWAARCSTPARRPREAPDDSPSARSANRPCSPQPPHLHALPFTLPAFSAAQRLVAMSRSTAT